MSQVRFQILYRVTSLTGAPDETDHVDWYGWRLMGANNRELGRSPFGYASYQLARRAIRQLKQATTRLVQHSATDPLTGRWGWRVDLDGAAVAVSGRWYERDHDGRAGASKFVTLARDAKLAEGVVTLHERPRLRLDQRASRVARLSAGGAG
jgi:hypothetical protein